MEMSMTLLERVAKCMKAGMSAHEIAAFVKRPIKQVRRAMYIVRYPDIEAARQAAFYAKYRNDPKRIERMRETARKYSARKRGAQTDDRGYVIPKKDQQSGRGA
jgi:hypothetical protein